MCTEKTEILKEKGVFEDHSIHGISYSVYCANAKINNLAGLLILFSAVLAMASF